MYLVVGAGLAGAVIAERIASQHNKEVTVIDRRNHIAGNIFDYVDENGIIVHKYGPHIFHTNSDKVWNYLNKFTDFEPYFHRVLAAVEGMEVPIPFNLTSLEQVYPKTKYYRMTEKLISEYGFGVKVPILKLLKSNHILLKELADYVYRNIFLGYTIKQWGLKPTEIDKSVTSRIPVYISKDTRYFQDKYQGMPQGGYTKMVEKMLSSKKIKVQLNTDFADIDDVQSYKKIIYTGCIDEYCNYKYGKLGYRSLEFNTIKYSLKQYQNVAQINYPNEYDFTRITEPKHFYKETKHNIDDTIILKEYPKEYIEKQNEPYYPILNDDNKILYKKYKEDVNKIKNIILLGRLADYKYYNMDQVISSSMIAFYKVIDKGIT